MHGIDDKIRVAVDDCRECSYADVLIRNGNLVVYIMKSLFDSDKEIHELFMDYDLGDESPNGKAILLTLLEQNICPKRVQLITMNPVGETNMENTLKDFGYIKSGGYWVKESN